MRNRSRTACDFNLCLVLVTAKKNETKKIACLNGGIAEAGNAKRKIHSIVINCIDVDECFRDIFFLPGIEMRNSLNLL